MGQDGNSNTNLSLQESFDILILPVVFGNFNKDVPLGNTASPAMAVIISNKDGPFISLTTTALPAKADSSTLPPAIEPKNNEVNLKNDKDPKAEYAKNEVAKVLLDELPYTDEVEGKADNNKKDSEQTKW